MGNLFYEQLQRDCEGFDYKELRKLIYKDRKRIRKLFEEEFESRGHYDFYYGMYLAYNNVLSMIIGLMKEGESDEGN